MLGSGLLKALIWAPVMGAAVIAVVPNWRGRLLGQLALLVTALAVAICAGLVVLFDPSGEAFQFVSSRPWNARLGSYFSLGVDGIALAMLGLTALLTFIAVLVSQGLAQGARLYFTLVLLLEAAMFGVFTARDWSLFYVFWEATLIPLFFLIDRLGGKNRQRAALNFFLYTLAGSVFILVSLLFLYDAAPGHSFAMADMAAGGRTLSRQTQLLIFAGLFIGFGVKMPVFPLHGWLPLAHVEAPSAVSILLSGVLLKMGAYGLIRSIDILPEALLVSRDALAALGAVSLLYGAILAWRQQDLKGMVAYSSIAHMGLVLLGIASLNAVGLSGAVTQMVAHGLTAGALFLWVGVLYQRTQQRDLARYACLFPAAPRLAVFGALFLLAGVGLPGSAGFMAEVQVLLGVWQTYGAWVIVPAGVVVLGAATALRVSHRLCLPSVGRMDGVADLSHSETLAACLLTLGIVGFGLLPGGLLAMLAGSVARLIGVGGGA